MTNIFVLGRTNLPILAALWATKLFVPGRETEEIKFMKRFPNLKDVKPNDLFVGSEDTLTRVEKAMMNGRMLETFPAIIKKYATQQDKDALEELVRLVSVIHPGKLTGHVLAPSASRANQQVITHTGLEAVLCSLKALYPQGGDIHYSRMTEIFDGILKSGRNRLQIKEAAEKTELLHNGRIAITSRAAYSPVHIALFQDYGVRVVIFNDGYNLGILRNPNEKVKLDNEQVLRLIEESSEMNEWELSPAGSLFQRGNPEKRKLEHSRVNKFRLANALANALDGVKDHSLALDRTEV